MKANDVVYIIHQNEIYKGIILTTRLDEYSLTYLVRGYDDINNETFLKEFDYFEVYYSKDEINKVIEDRIFELNDVLRVKSLVGLVKLDLINELKSLQRAKIRLMVLENVWVDKLPMEHIKTLVETYYNDYMKIDEIEEGNIC